MSGSEKVEYCRVLVEVYRKNFARLRRTNFFTLLRFYNLFCVGRTFTLLQVKAQTFTQPPPYDSGTCVNKVSQKWLT